MRKRAHRLAKCGARINWLFPAAAPAVFRECSLVLAALGKTAQALQFADKSCVIAQLQQAKYEHAQSLLVRGRLAKELELPEADAQIQTAEAALAAINKRYGNARPGRHGRG